MVSYMIDDSIPPMLGALKVAISRITDKPVDFLINTHFHRDHSGNNFFIGKMGAKIFAHENTRKRLLAARRGSSKVALPVITFAQQINFYLNGNNTHIIHVADAHTDSDSDSDIIINFKNLRTNCFTSTATDTNVFIYVGSWHI